MSSPAVVVVKAANAEIMCHSYKLLFWLSDSQDQKLLPDCWRSFPGWGNVHGTFVFTYKKGQYDHLTSISQCRPLFAENIRPENVDASLTLTLKTYSLSFVTQQLFEIMHKVIIGSWWIVSMY